ncbi:MAG: aldehyde dehydrogenase family protein [Nostocoides sp.]
MAAMTALQLFIDGQWCDGGAIAVKTDTWSGEPVADVHIATRAQVEKATRALAEGQRAMSLSPHARYTMLMDAAGLLGQRVDAFVEGIVADTGFTMTDAKREVERAIETLTLSAEEAKRLHGEVVPMASDPTNPQRLAFTVLRPLGVVCAITPFNSPLNTVLHKVAPALAAGNAVILKPAMQTPITADLLLHLLLDAGVPPSLLALVQGRGSEVGQWLLEDPVPAFYAFTGSTEVGETISRTIGVRRAQLELGSLASTIVCHDADLARATALVVNAAFRKAGQVCTSVQRVYVHDSIRDEFTTALVSAAGEKKAGDPRDPTTFLGPLIDLPAAERVDSWIQEAARRGATVHLGGNRQGSLLDPTILSDVPKDASVMCSEVFGPVLSLVPFADLDAALDGANDTPYGLAAGIFTRDIASALGSAARLRMGTVHINETSSARVDLMPFGGVKLSGHGKEGPAYAIREMSDETLITMGTN